MLEGYLIYLIQNTSVGRLNLKLHRVRDKEEEKIFLPVEDRVEFDGKKVYQEDISMISAELATRLTYGIQIS